MPIDGVLLLGFGGVTDSCCQRQDECPGRVECFIGKVLGDDPRMASRIADVASHYHHLGGKSPYNELTFAQANALEAALAERGRPLPVACGFRNWPPWYSDGLDRLAAQGCRQVVLLVLAPHQCSRSWDDYLTEARAAADELRAAGRPCPELVDEIAPYFMADGFIAASAERIRAATADWSAERFAAAELVLTAHAIPQPAEAASPYRQQIEATAAAVAEAVGHPRHRLAFQSAPDRSRIPWSTPRVEEVVAACATDGAVDIVVQAVGFLVDHIEVLFDLDEEVARQAAELGLGYARATCVQDHPAFIGMLADQVVARLPR